MRKKAKKYHLVTPEHTEISEQLSQPSACPPARPKAAIGMCFVHSIRSAVTEKLSQKLLLTLDSSVHAHHSMLALARA